MKKEEIHQIKLAMEPEECKKLCRILEAAEREDIKTLSHLKKDIFDFKEVLNKK